MSLSATARREQYLRCRTSPNAAVLAEGRRVPTGYPASFEGVAVIEVEEHVSRQLVSHDSRWPRNTGSDKG